NANGTLTGSTRVNIKNAIVYQVFGGNADGTLTGSTCVNIEAGNVYQVFGGNAGGVLEGDTCVNISGISADDVYGGNANGTLTGSTCVNMEAGNVWQIFGGNAEGTLDGDARVNISGGNATYVYGGGNHAEISGNTSIYITGGCADNIYGGSSTGQVNGNSLVDVKNAKIGTVFGGNKVSGKVTGDTNLVFGENTQATGWIYGGGEGSDGNAIVEVTGSTNIIVNDGTFTQIFGGGRKHATVGNSNITVNAGNISSYIYGGGEEKSSVTGKASITVNGGSLYGVCASGASGAGTTVEDAEIFLKNVEIKYFNCDSPVEGKLSVSFENASASTFLLAEKAFNTAGATLSFIDCGSAEKGWTEQPEVGFRPNQNKFHTILIQNSYIRFQDNSTENGSVINDCTLDGCTENLILDGGALWVKEGMRFNMPVTEFRNEPLILRTGGMAIHFDEVPNGTARIQWMNEDGTVPDNPSGQALVEAPTDTPDKTFVSGDARYGLKTDSIAQDNGIWRGKAWYVIDLATTCNCTLLSALLQEYVFPLSIDGEQTVVTLKDVYEGSTAYSANCPVIGHDGTAVTAEYSLIAEGTTAKGASINGNQLTVEGMGSVHIMVRQQLNGKSREDDCYVQIMEFPESDNYTFTVGMIEEISFAFGEINAAGILNNAVLWSDTDNKYVDSANYSVTEEDNRVRFVINKNYLEGLSLGKYGFRASIPYRDGEGKMSGYMYCFTVNIVPVIVVDDPVIELLEEPLHYDGKEKKPAVVVKYGDTVIPEEEYTVSYENNIDVSQDSKPAKVIIMDVEGGRYQVNGTREFEIINEYTAKAGTDYELPELNEYGWTNKEFVISAAEDHLLSTGNTLDGEWTEQLPPYTEETGDGSVTFYVKDTETGLISLAVTEKYKLDQTAPEITDILFDGKSVKTELDENIPFSSLFGKDVKVEITAEDKLSGIAGISYLQSEKILTQEELEKTDGWTDERESDVSAKDGKKFLIYGKAADLAGNTVYFASEGGEFDLKAPEIGGIESGSTYYVTQAVSVADAHLDTVTVNGEAVSEKESLLLPGNVDAAYEIRAVDQLGNETVATVTMKLISSLAEPIRGLSEDTVTSADAETIRQVLETAEGVNAGNASPAEAEELQKLIDNCRLLDERIKAAHEEYDRIADEMGGISVDTVALTDQKVLEEAKEALERLLEEYEGNYTEAERGQIETDLTRVTKSLESIRKVREAESIIAQLPDAEGVSPDNVEAEKAAEEALNSLRDLTEHEKSLVDTGRLEQLLEALAAYRIVEGDGSEWVQGETGEISFKANGAFSKFIGILIDGQSTDPGNYTAAEGSTIITLKESLLKTLVVGSHGLTVLYSDGGKASAEFKITEPDRPEATNTPEPEAINTPEPEATDTP
ncbi:MAG TPA: hypothetical protein DCZ91_14695, partial [Lachnospiraceae bacterium]|nr:hypothetical protein [Lachnospiraceae bacterium]